MPQPGFLSTKLSIAIWYLWWNWHIESLRPSTEFTVAARKNQKKLSPIVSKENIQSISSIWSVNLLCFFQCASTNRNILTLSSIWPVKSTCFFRLECPNRGSFWRNSGLSCAVVKMPFGHVFFWYCIQQEPQKIRKNKSHSLEITYSVNYLLSDR